MLWYKCSSALCNTIFTHVFNTFSVGGDVHVGDGDVVALVMVLVMVMVAHTGGINKATKEAEIASYWTSCSHISSPSFLLHTNTKIQSACKYKYVKSVMQIKCKCWQKDKKLDHVRQTVAEPVCLWDSFPDIWLKNGAEWGWLAGVYQIALL